MGEPAANVVELGAHVNMTPEQALRLVLREQPTDVLILTYQDGELVIRSSKMTRADALWMLENAKLHALDRDSSFGGEA
jgi:TATA-box binding protein (TBP) (component of TFIID and TFIIIB)